MRFTARARRLPALALAAPALTACAGGGDAPGEGLQVPVLLTTDLPFRYPPELLTAAMEGDVALRLYVDSLGLVVPESTRVVEPSDSPAFDSAAVAGAPFLQFRPAQRGASRLGHAVVLPVRFRLPRADSGARDTTTR